MTYGMSVAVWLAFYISFIHIFKERFFENGWINEEYRSDFMCGSSYIWLLICAMVPFWRIIIAASFVGAALIVNEDEDQK